MAGEKETYQIALNPDQMDFIRSARDQFDIADEDKVVRIVLDYVLSNPDLHETIFTETRCLRCE